MFAVRFLLFVVLISFWYSCAKAEDKGLQNCEAQLNMYRKLILQPIPSFEDVCNAYNTRSGTPIDTGLPPQITFFGRYQPAQENTDAWSFFKFVLAQFNDIEFTNIIHDAVIERCRMKLQLQQQRDEKRNAVVLGKKQKFHSWGGKRNGDGISYANFINDLKQEHNDDINLGF